MKAIKYPAFILAVLSALATAVPARAGATNLVINPSGGTTFDGGSIDKGLVNNGGTAQTGSIVINPIGTPDAPTVSPTGAATHTYYCVATDINLNQTVASSGTTAPGSNPTTVTCAGKTGAVGYIVLKDSTATGSDELGSCTTVSGASCNVVDTGQALTAYTASQDQTSGIQLTLPSAGNLPHGYMAVSTGSDASGIGFGIDNSAGSKELGIYVASAWGYTFFLDDAYGHRLAANGNQIISFSPFLPDSTSVAGITCDSNHVGWSTATDSTAVTTEGQTCVGSSTNTAAVFCDGATKKCF
jgi:hypothetical protein